MKAVGVATLGLTAVAAAALGWLWLAAGVGAIRPLPPSAIATETAAVKSGPPAHADPELIEPGSGGFLPRISDDGRTASEAYALAYEKKGKQPRVAVIVTNLGLKRAVTLDAIGKLPPAVALAFSPYAEDLSAWAAQARKARHEILAVAPMEPVGYPSDDPGDLALFTGLTGTENVERLKHIMAAFTSYVGVTNHMGSRFLASAKAVRPVFEELRDRGLFYVDNGGVAGNTALKVAVEIGLARAAIDRRIDTDPSPDAIATRLGEIEDLARRQGSAIAVGYPYPVTIERLAAWIKTLEKRGLVLVPVSALVRKPAKR